MGKHHETTQKTERENQKRAKRIAKAEKKRKAS